MVLIKLIFFVLVFYYLLKSVGKLLLQPFLRNIAKNTGGQNQNYYHRKKEGEVTIEYQSKKNGGSNKNIGEYVDFEEIKD